MSQLIKKRIHCAPGTSAHHLDLPPAPQRHRGPPDIIQKQRNKNHQGPATLSDQGEILCSWSSATPSPPGATPSLSASTPSRRPEEEEEIEGVPEIISEGISYLTGSGPGAWLEPPALQSSSQPSLEPSSWLSATLPGRSQGFGGRNEGVPVVSSNFNGTLQAKILQLDCRGTKVPDLRGKTTVAVGKVRADQDSRSGETSVPSQGFVAYHPSKSQGRRPSHNQTLRQPSSTTTPDEVTSKHQINLPNQNFSGSF